MRSPSRLACLFIALLLLVYSAFRSYALAFTHDESYTFLHFFQHSFSELMRNDTSIVSANNHILNTLCMKWAGSVWGHGEFALRFHSWLAHAFYLLLTYLFLRSFHSGKVLLIGFLLLNLNPFLIDFFSLARGYAMAIALMLGSIYFLTAYARHERYRDLLLSLGLACLAVLANFALLTYVAALMICLAYVFLYKGFPLHKLMKHGGVIVLGMVCIGLLCYPPVRQLLTHHELYAGGTNGFWSDTVGSLIDASLYRQGYWSQLPLFLTILIASVFIGCLCKLVFTAFRTRALPVLDRGSVFFVLLLLIIGINYAQHVLMDGKFLSERFALFLLPLFMFSVIDLWVFIYRQYLRSKALQWSLALMVLLPIGFHVCATFNVTHCQSWKYDADNKNMLRDLQRQIAHDQKQQVRLGIIWILEPSLHYYKQTWQLHWLAPLTHDGLSGRYDYYYASEEGAAELSHDQVLKRYPVSGGILARREP